MEREPAGPIDGHMRLRGHSLRLKPCAPEPDTATRAPRPAGPGRATRDDPLTHGDGSNVPVPPAGAACTSANPANFARQPAR